MRTTSEIAKQFGLELVGDSQIVVSSVALSTAHVSPGSLFIAVQGRNSHGLDHLKKAIELGAVAVLSDSQKPIDLPSFYHPAPREIAGLISDAVYGTFESEMALFAVTGTNGKTSTVFYLAQLLNELGQSCGLVSSAQVRVGSGELEVELTTPEAPRLHQLLSSMRELGQLSCAVEASAQGLSRHRLDGLRFRVAGFTNLSRDHLDDYPNMETYLEAKANLFKPNFAGRAVVLLEDEGSKSLFEEIKIPKAGIGQDYEYLYDSEVLSISGRHSLEFGIQLPTLMAKNLVLALVMLLEDGVDPAALSLAAKRISPLVPGRLQRVSERSPAVFVDYAHTPAAVGASAQELSTKFSELTIILTASGDRDRGKRAEMATAAAQYASRIVITDQHPRSENPAAIRKDLRDAIKNFSNLEEIADPALAIARAVEITNPGGAILWCGPGHLKYREIAGSKEKFDAVWEARRVLGHD